MTGVIIKIEVTDTNLLIEEIHDRALRYCKFSLQQRLSCIDDGDIYLIIELSDERLITAIPIGSFEGHDLHEIEDSVLMDARDVKSAIEANLLCMLGEVKDKFVTQTDSRDSKDILLWQIRKSS